MITINSTHKPAQIVARMTAKVTTTAPHTKAEVITAGLTALGETRSSVFHYGIDHDDMTPGELPPGVYTVFAHRD